MNIRMLPLAVATALLALPLPSYATAPQAQAIPGKGEVAFDTSIDAAALQLRVTGPGGFLREALYLKGEPLSLPISSKQGWPDGQYHFELWPVTGMARRTGSEAVQASRAGSPSASGSFHVTAGEVVAPVAGSGPGDQDGGSMAKDQVIPDDLIVQGSECVGLDCVANENFGFDTIRLKENNLRIKFEDTSVGTFPTNDWQLTANDSASGGASKFSIEDITGAKVPFTVTAGATTNSIFVDSTGRVGFRTSTPVLDLHVSTGNTPAMRLEQTSAGGFTAQTWDIGANEANFFVRDVTGGSRLPFRIRPGAPTSSIDVSANGDVGIGALPLSFPDHRNITIRGASGGSTYEHADNTGVRKAFWVYNATGEVSFGTVAGAGPIVLNPEAGGGNVGIGATPTAKLDVNGDTLRVRSPRVPGTASSACNQGDISWGTDFVYVCVATNTWKRAALSSW